MGSGSSGSEATKPLISRKTPTMDHLTCGPGARWCARADAMFAVPGMDVLDVDVDHEQRLVLCVESGQLEAGCPACGVLAVGHGRRVHVLHDAPCFGRVTVLQWRKRVWRCREPLFATDTFSEVHDLAPPRALLTVRAVRWATDALSQDDTTVSALARHLGVDWHTACRRSRSKPELESLTPAGCMM